MTLIALLSLALAVPPAVEQLPSPKDHFPREEWSEFSWNGLRWGMGLGDVLAVLKAKDGGFRVASNFRCDGEDDKPGISPDRVENMASCWIEPRSHSLDIVGSRPLISLAFWKQRLYGVLVTIPGKPEFAAFQKQVESTVTILGEKYGRFTAYPPDYKVPTSPPKDYVGIQFDWSSAPLLTSVSLSVAYGIRGPPKRSKYQMSLHYSDMKAGSDINRGTRVREVQGERDKF